MYVFVAQCAYADFELSQLKDDIELGDIALTIERFINILTEDPYHVFEPEYDQHDLDRDYAGFTN